VLTEHGVPIAPRTFHAWVGRAPSKRALWDAAITAVLAGYYEPDEHGRRKPESLYGSLKMWHICSVRASRSPNPRWNG
jgi:putative transposase